MLHTITKVFAFGSIVWLVGCGNSGSTYIEEAPPLLEIGVDENLVVEENLVSVTDIELINGDVQVDELQITGPDREHFELVARSQLSFVSAPDFENPASDDSDNIYEITIEASSGASSASKALTVSVTDVHELHLGPYFPIAENERDYLNYDQVESNMIVEELHSEDTKFWGGKFLDEDHFLATRQDGFFVLYDVVDQEVHRFDINEAIDLFKQGQGGLYNFDFRAGGDNSFEIIFAAAVMNDDLTAELAVYSSTISTANGLTMSAPYQHYKTQVNSNSEYHFGGDVQIFGEQVFVSSGDRHCRTCSQNEGDQRGKILSFDIQNDGKLVASLDNPFKQSGRPEVFSKGHRNPQGIEVADEFGTVLSAEHGPQGGDEINVLTAGLNYGWPLATFGEEYGGGNIGVERIDEYRDSVLYYLPSIAPRELKYVEQNELFPELNNSILIASLKFEMVVVLKLNQARPQQKVIDLSGYGRISSFDINSKGEIFFVTHSTPGRLFRIR